MVLLKSSDYSYRKPRFSFQHSQGGLQLTVTPVPEDLMPSSGLWTSGCTDVRADKIPIHRKQK